MPKRPAAPVATHAASERPQGFDWRVIATRTTAATVGWWVLSEGRADSWALGAAVIALAVAASLRLAAPQPRLRWRATLRFMAFFLLFSLRAGVQVAVLAFAPRARLAPGMVEVRLTLPPGPPRYLLLAVLSLLPGTLSVALDGARLVVHALTGLATVEDEVRALEARIAPLFGSAP